MSTSTKKNDGGTDPIDDRNDVRKNPDPKIDEDFPGFPDAPSTKENVKPDSPSEKDTADSERDGEKKLDADKKASAPDEAGSDGSASAFDRTEPAAIPATPSGEPQVAVKKRRSDGSANAFERTEISPLNEEEEEGPDSYY
ncbi:MAG: hypothetical protein EOO09_10835 [Chitinophagaceae bacterium]|nr:MAG: hypothetical protein EOO09_10835 [Chitinophagaceae bacterium]